MPSCRNDDWIKNLYELRSRVHPSGNYVDHQRHEVAPSHRKETVGKRKTAKSSPPGDRKIERRKRCVTHPGFNIRASATTAFEGPSSKLKPQQEPESIYPRTIGAIPGARDARPHEPRTPMPRAPREESSDSTHFSAKRQRDKKSQLSNSMRARLGPQEPGRSRPPMATTWAPRPDPIATPMVQNVHPHRDPVVTPVMWNVHSHPAEQQLGGTSQTGHLLAPSAKGWMTCSPRLLLSYH
ncbi:hypothetical protein CK203_006876 [Vitis vinifera]|uniref:Uncharacterized protein n=1 Tax=Vitis vinifera TaxID=29760 RepID=A0A438KC79_VITVI|nr:hypothetical protein CK203_006876 [Vitis vinifera]